MSRNKHINVHVRWRPLDVSEQAHGEMDRHYSTDNNSKTKVALALSRDTSSAARTSTWNSTAAFTHIFETASTNQELFDTIVAPALPLVLGGSTCNFFAFGHTGSGKTHTVVGEAGGSQTSRLGLYFLAARRLVQDLHRSRRRPGHFPCRPAALRGLV